MDDWKKLYQAAKHIQKSRVVSPFIEVGGVAAALLTVQGNIYTGICIDTACSLGLCAERNAITNMLTNGESEILKILIMMPDGSIGFPCGACRELMMQLSPNSGNIEILAEYDSRKTMLLKDLVPAWWGADKFQEV